MSFSWARNWKVGSDMVSYALNTTPELKTASSQKGGRGEKISPGAAGSLFNGAVTVPGSFSSQSCSLALQAGSELGLPP